MIPARLVIINFSCHERSEIDFTQFSTALIVGKTLGNDDISNGVGKTTIFKAIEYVLFNESDESLDRIIRDDCTSCKVILYFKVDEQLYRVSRSRNTKGTSDLALHVRSTEDGADADVYVDVIEKDNKFWKDKTSRRTGDTEKDLEKLIKINYKGFRSTVHFVQNDFTGIATLTPEKRKALLKEILQILIYAKLEKIAKDRATEINKEIARIRSLAEALGDPDKDIADSETQVIDFNSRIADKTVEQEKIKELSESINLKIAEISNALSSFDERGAQVKQKEIAAKNELQKIRATLSDYSGKTKSVALAAKTILADIKSENEKKAKLSEINFEETAVLEIQLAELKEQTITEQLTVKKLTEELEELKIPMPDDSICKHCRQPLTEEHKVVCQEQINNRIVEITSLLKGYSNSIRDRNTLQSQIAIKITQLNNSKKELDATAAKIDNLKKDYENKKQLYADYEKIITEQNQNLSQKESEVEVIVNELEAFNTDEVKKLRTALDEQKRTKDATSSKDIEVNKELTHFKSSIAVLDHKIKQAKDNKIKKKDFTEKLTAAEDELSIYPSVIQAFSSQGIPNLIIQNVLDDWQDEANKLLSQIRPGLQLSFYVEKENSKGETADTLEIEYFLNNRQREYGLLSGAQKVSVLFSLKLGLTFLLQKMFGSDLRLLCLDEVDQPFDKAGVNAFVDIVKFFQKDFTILVITHNDRLKDKFAHAILVEQDQNMVSKAKVVSSW